MSAPSDSPSPTQPAVADAPRRSIIFYAIGNMENALANQFFNILSIVTVVALGMSPLLIGLLISIKTIFDAVTDPLMAYVTDNFRTRWGRRIPYILFGGISRVLLVLLCFIFLPRSDTIKTNAQYAEEKAAKIAAEQAGRQALTPPSPATPDSAADPAQSAKVTPATPALPKPKPMEPSLLQKFKEGFAALTTAAAPYQKHVFYYLFVISLLYALLSTIHSVPYYALGIEIAPSYDGRTKVVTYRAYADKLMALVSHWVLPFCFLPMFLTVFDGLVWYGVMLCLVGMPTTIAMCKAVKEPVYSTVTVKKKAPPLFKSIWQTASNIHFLKILFLYIFIGFSNGIFAQVGTFLVLYWVFAGDMLSGTVVNGYAATIATVLGFATLPLIQWACRRFSKHAALRAAIIWMAIGAAMKWFLYNPRYPYLQLLLPFFFSIGIGSVYTVLPSLMADVTDVDELNNGERREGMFGAVMSFLNKAIGSLQPVLAAAVLTASGFDASLGVHQPDEVIHRMRLMASWIPAILLLGALLALLRYPLTRARMAEIQATLLQRRAEKDAQAAGGETGHPQS